MTTHLRSYQKNHPKRLVRLVINDVQIRPQRHPRVVVVVEVRQLPDIGKQMLWGGIRLLLHIGEHASHLSENASALVLGMTSPQRRNVQTNHLEVDRKHVHVQTRGNVREHAQLLDRDADLRWQRRPLQRQVLRPPIKRLETALVVDAVCP